MHFFNIILQIVLLLSLFLNINRAQDKRKPYAERTYFMARACFYLIVLAWLSVRP